MIHETLKSRIATLKSRIITFYYYSIIFIITKKKLKNRFYGPFLWMGSVISKLLPEDKLVFTTNH